MGEGEKEGEEEGKKYYGGQNRRTRCCFTREKNPYPHHGMVRPLRCRPSSGS